jgi:hypothetical protein
MAALLLLLCAVATNGAEPEPGAAARRPASAAPRLQPSWVWSWDTLPVWGCGQGAADFTSADVALLTRYPLMWTQGERYLGGGKWIAENKTGYTNYENATATDARKIHAVRKDEPVMGYTGFMGSCSGYDNWWCPEAAAKAAAGRSHSAHVLKTDDDPAAAGAAVHMASPGARSQQLILTGGDTATVGCTPSHEFNCSYAAFRIPVRKTASFLSFPYVCPEPVLAK